MDWRIAKSIFVCEDRKKAEEYALGNGSPYVFYYSQLLTKMLKHGRANLFKEDQNMSDDALKLEDICKKLILFGTPDEVADIVVDEIRQGIFWVLPHKHYGDQALDQAKRRVTGGGPVMPHIER